MCKGFNLDRHMLVALMLGPCISITYTLIRSALEHAHHGPYAVVIHTVLA